MFPVPTVWISLTSFRRVGLFIVFAKDIYASEVFGRALMRKLLPVWLLKEQGEQNVKTN